MVGLEPVRAGQRDAASLHAGGPRRPVAGRHARRDRADVVDDRRHDEAEGVRLGVVAPALDEQRVRAAERQRRGLDVGTQAPVEDLPAVRIDQPPRGIGARDRLQVEVEARSGGGLELVRDRRIAGAQLARHRDARRDGRGAGEVEQPEGVAPGLIVRRIDDERVVAGDEVQDEIGSADVVRVRVPQLAPADHDAAGPAERPVDVRVDERIEIELARLVEREGVDVARAGLADAALHDAVEAVGEAAERAGDAVGRGRRGPAAVGERQVQREPGFRAGERDAAIGADLLERARAVPQTDLVDGAGQPGVVVPRGDAATDQQRRGVRRCRGRARGARRDLRVVDDEPHDAGGAVDHAGDVVPLARANRARRRDGFLSGGRQQDASVGIQPHGVRALLPVVAAVLLRHALVDERRPRIDELVDPERELDGHAAREIGRGTVRHLDVVEIAEREAVADAARDAIRTDTDRLADHDRQRLVDDPLDREPVGVRFDLVAAPLDEQRVRAGA